MMVRIMTEIIIHSKFGKITAQAMSCVDIKKSIPEEAERSITEEESDLLPEYVEVE